MRLERAPRVGGVYEAAARLKYRRLGLPERRHHFNYRVVGPALVGILAVWSAVRGRGPHL